MQRSEECWGPDVQEWNPDRWFRDGIQAKHSQYWLIVRALSSCYQTSTMLLTIRQSKVRLRLQQMPGRTSRSCTNLKDRRNYNTRLHRSPGRPKK
jgi:hypothetical protein